MPRVTPEAANARWAPKAPRGECFRSPVLTPWSIATWLGETRERGACTARSQLADVVKPPSWPN